MAGSKQIWEDVKAAVEGHLDVEVLSVHSVNGMEVSVVIDTVEEDWTPECLTGAWVALEEALERAGEPHKAEIANVILTSDTFEPGAVIIEIQFLLSIKPADPKLN